MSCRILLGERKTDDATGQQNSGVSQVRVQVQHVQQQQQHQLQRVSNLNLSALAHHAEQTSVQGESGGLGCPHNA